MSVLVTAPAGAAPTPVKPTTPVVAPVPAAAPPAVSQELSAAILEATRAKNELEKKSKEHIIERRKWDGEKRSFSDRLKDADEMAQLRKEAPINPLAVARKLFGEKAYEVLTQAQLGGGAASAESVQMELEKRDKAWEAKLKERDDAEAQRAAEARSQSVAQRRAEFTNSVAKSIKGADADLPLLLAAFGDEKRAAAGVMQRIETRWREATRDGAQAEPMSWRAAADELEGELLSLAERATAHAKYQSRLKEKLTTPPASGGNTALKPQQQPGSQQQPHHQQQVRRTLSNDLTGSTQARRAPPVSDEERQQRVWAAYDAAKAKRSDT